MKNVEKHLVGWLSVCLLLCSFQVWAQGDAGDYLTIVGMVKDKQNKKALENVNVSVHGSNIGTVTNAEDVYKRQAQGGAQGGAQAGPDMNGDAGQQDNSKHGDNVQDCLLYTSTLAYIYFV